MTDQSELIRCLIAYRALVLGTVRDGKRSHSLARRGCGSLDSLIGDLIVEDAFVAILMVYWQIIHFLLLVGPPKGSRDGTAAVINVTVRAGVRRSFVRLL